jgi:hypothetical protein
VLERRLLEVLSLSFTRECDFLSGDKGGVPWMPGLPGVPGLLCGEGRGTRFGTSGVFDFFEDLAKNEGRTMGATGG